MKFRKWFKDNKISIIIELSVVVITIAFSAIIYLREFGKIANSLEDNITSDLYLNYNNNVLGDDLGIDGISKTIDYTVYRALYRDPEARTWLHDVLYYSTKEHPRKYLYPFAARYQFFDKNQRLIYDNKGEYDILINWSEYDNYDDAVEAAGNENSSWEGTTYSLKSVFTQKQIESVMDRIICANEEEITHEVEVPIVKITGYYYEDSFVIVSATFSFWDNNKESDVLYVITNEKNNVGAKVNMVDRYNVKYLKEYENEIENNGAEVGEFGNPFVSIDGIANLNESNRKSRTMAKKYFDLKVDHLILDELKEEYVEYICDYGLSDDYYKNSENVGYIIAQKIKCDNPKDQDVVYVKAVVCCNIPMYVLLCTSFLIRSLLFGTILQLMAIIFIIFGSRYKRKIEELKETKSMFINAIAHEMKTPTAVIMNSSECIKEGIHPEKREHYQEIVYDEANHISDLVDQMLTYTRVTDSYYKPAMDEVVINDIVREVCKRFKVLKADKKISLKVNNHAQFVVNGDRKLLEMVVDNYISNAVKYCKEDGKIIINIDVTSLKVFNEGDHIKSEDLKKIWEPLYKEDESRKKDDGSSGMGLAISAGIMKLHRLKYGVENVEGGVEFYFKSV
ncbi:MAG: HAMP domain-containing histidine kinase [Lachnospiraceae bacterium]|nr:HAMP domain-containing histidine kinase [Lachnospiraceae bacterium]